DTESKSASETQSETQDLSPDKYKSEIPIFGSAFGTLRGSSLSLSQSMLPNNIISNDLNDKNSDYANKELYFDNYGYKIIGNSHLLSSTNANDSAHDSNRNDSVDYSFSPSENSKTGRRFSEPDKMINFKTTKIIQNSSHFATKNEISEKFQNELVNDTKIMIPKKDLPTTAVMITAEEHKENEKRREEEREREEKLEKERCRVRERGGQEEMEEENESENKLAKFRSVMRSNEFLYADKSSKKSGNSNDLRANAILKAVKSTKKPQDDEKSDSDEEDIENESESKLAKFGSIMRSNEFLYANKSSKNSGNSNDLRANAILKAAKFTKKPQDDEKSDSDEEDNENESESKLAKFGSVMRSNEFLYTDKSSKKSENSNDLRANAILNAAKSTKKPHDDEKNDSDKEDIENEGESKLKKFGSVLRSNEFLFSEKNLEHNSGKIRENIPIDDMPANENYKNLMNSGSIATQNTLESNQTNNFGDTKNTPSQINPVFAESIKQKLSDPSDKIESQPKKTESKIFKEEIDAERKLTNFTSVVKKLQQEEADEEHESEGDSDSEGEENNKFSRFGSVGCIGWLLMLPYFSHIRKVDLMK
ncbi:hypothetical protein HK096_005598, partial [Nowakowskiella sp. JEL0078]